MKRLSDFIEKQFLVVAQVILFTFPITFILGYLSLLFHTGLYNFIFPLAFLCSILLNSFEYGYKRILFPSILAFSFIGFSLFIINKTYDASWDGQWYHQDAIIKLINDWNPFTSKSNPQLSISESDIWIHHYPHSSWIVKATILKFTNLIQSTKAVLGLLSVSCFLICFSFLRNDLRIKPLLSALISLSLVLNPVISYQLFSFMVDGESGVLIAIYLILILRNIFNPSKFIILQLFLVFIYAINIKFTTLIYLSIFNIAYFAWLMINDKKNRLLAVKLFSLLYFSSICLFGYTSYIRNTVEHGHPLYPIMGKDSYGKIVANIPASANFINNDRFSNFLSSTFAYPEYSRYPDSTKFRIPFTKVEYKNFIRTDIEISGFGARTSEIFIFTCMLLVILITSYSSKKEVKLGLIIILAILISVFLNEQAYFARYVPQYWLVPIILGLLSYQVGTKVLKYSVILFFLFLLYNSLNIIKVQYKYQKEVVKNIRDEANYFKSFKSPVLVNSKYLSITRRLEELNVPFKLIHNDETNRQHYGFYYGFSDAYYIIP